ncbi:MAG: alpha-L-fucosidase [Firmicutes bacterium]|nr:alpha-L-fucosidase [Bacillota bacterium]
MNAYKLLYGPQRRFGMFIHWGLYALTEYHEQILRRTPMERDDYEKLISQFNPASFSADEWVRQAKEAGMSYICFTTKHHDGFCMWDTQYTDYNVMHTPFGRDVVKEFSEACKKYDMGLGLYYSVPDWHHPNAYNPLSTHQLPPRPSDRPDMDAYVDYIKHQITELLTNYGPICCLFWDIPPHIDDPSLNELARQLQPGIRINDRGFDPGDYSTPERHVPNGAFTRLTEGCQSVGRQSWGYRRNEDYYTARFLESSMDTILSKGGNYLLNIGPMPDGSMPPKALELLQNVGSWYKRVTESYMGKYPSQLFSDQTAFTVTQNENQLYLHFNGYPEANGVCLRPLDILPTEVTLLNTGEHPDVALDVIPTLFMEPDGQTPWLHVYNLPFDELAGEVPVLRLTFESAQQLQKYTQASAVTEAIF